MDQTTGTPQQEDKLGTPLTILSFCIWPVGIILYFVKKNDQPQAAKTACYASLVAIGLIIVINIIAGIAGVSLSGGN